MDKLQEFTDFLKTVDLTGYRIKYKPINFLEMNMREEIQAIKPLYQVYWVEKKFLPFEEFYKRYVAERKEKLEEFRIKTTLCEPDFYRGLEARIYRTWAGLITQIHAGYVAEKVFGEGNVKMSADLDYDGADIRVEYKGEKLNYQIKKTSYTGVRGAIPLPKKPKLDGRYIDQFYEVPSSEIFNDPKKKNGEYRAPYKRFMEDPTTERLENGFIIFTDYVFKNEKDRIDSQAAGKEAQTP